MPEEFEFLQIEGGLKTQGPKVKTHRSEGNGFSTKPSFLTFAICGGSLLEVTDGPAETHVRELQRHPFQELKMHPWQHTHTHTPDNREQDGSAADEVDQEDDILPQVILCRTFLCGLDDDVSDVSKDLEEGRSVHHGEK